MRSKKWVTFLVLLFVVTAFSGCASLKEKVQIVDEWVKEHLW